MVVPPRDRIELHMLSSLARSQRALCRILESAADQVEASGVIAQHAADHLELLSRYQQAMIRKLTRLRPRKRRSGPPALPWLSKNEGVCTGTGRQFPRK